MSQLYVDNIKGRTGGPVALPQGAVVSGIITATSFSGNGSGLTGLNIPVSSDWRDASLF